MVVGFCWMLLFLFVPETFWDRTPRPKSRHTSKNNSTLSFFRHILASHVSHHLHPHAKGPPTSHHQVDGSGEAPLEQSTTTHSVTEPALRRPSQTHRPGRSLHVGFAGEEADVNEKSETQNTYDGHASPPNDHIEPAAVGTSPVEPASSGKPCNLTYTSFSY